MGFNFILSWQRQRWVLRFQISFKPNLPMATKAEEERVGLVIDEMACFPLAGVLIYSLNFTTSAFYNTPVTGLLKLSVVCFHVCCAASSRLRPGLGRPSFSR
jgi:hypothetical protein